MTRRERFSTVTIRVSKLRDGYKPKLFVGPGEKVNQVGAFLRRDGGIRLGQKQVCAFSKSSDKFSKFIINRTQH